MAYISPQNKIFRHFDRIDAIKKGVIKPPVNVEIDLSNRCNLGCWYCHFAYTHTRGMHAGKFDKPKYSSPGGDLMDFELAERMITQLQDYGVRSITWTGGGEPTLHPRFLDIISLVKIDQGIYTNGTNIDKEAAEYMKSSFKWVYVSLDACDADTYLLEKGSKLFDRAIEGVKNLVGSPGDATIGLGFMINARNYLGIDYMLDLGEKLGVDYVQFRPSVIFDMSNPSKALENTYWVNNAIESLDLLPKSNRLIADIDRFREYRDWNRHNYKICYWSRLQTVITPNGKVWTCVNKREFTGDEIGDLSVESFSDVWSRHTIAMVDYNCRIACRGYPGNLVLNELFENNEHGNFI